ncbi:MAG: polyprenyl synthetase family protein [Phycisphaerae bacterium]|nr:polyprenyl synthetase family protein [Phycisphaerae bacterium]MDD5381482.1 polyprenyl synthetase family protein [Phycisphaerae bacterium]
MQLPAHTDISGSLPRNGVTAFRVINDELGQVKELISNELLNCPGKAGVKHLVEHQNSSGGKMIRPGLVLLAGRAVGKITDKHICIAAIMEMIHNATLLHDDVIDEGQSRRGRATVNSLWGNESAVLLGDFLLSKVFKMCADLEPHIVKIIAAAAGRTCEGELRQITQRGNWQLSETEYIDIITDKSAALFSSCCYLGGFLGGAGEAELELLSDFGLNFGIAFQITDDLLDLVGDQNKTGKSIGNDLDNGKVTLPVIHLLKTANETDKELVMGILDGGGEKGRRKRYDVLAEKLQSCGSIGYAQKRAQEFAEQAIAAIEGFNHSESKDALIELSRFAAQRVT